MTVSYTLFMVAGHARPVERPAPWIRFFTTEGYGAELESERRGIARLYALALVLFVVAVILYVALPVVPR